MKVNQTISLLSLLVLLTTSGWTQGTEELADEYYKTGAFEKAAVEYAKSMRKSASWPTVFRYVNSLLKTEKADEASRYLKKQVRADELNKPYYDLLTGYVAKQFNDTIRAKQAFEIAVGDIKASPEGLTKLAVAFMDINEPDWAIIAYKKARDTGKDEKAYAEELAALYKTGGSTDKWIDELLIVGQEPEKKESVLNSFQTVINTKDEPILEKALYDRSQRYPNELYYSETLSWYFVQKQRFSRALIQEKAVDKRLRLSGSRVYDLGLLALTNKDYKAAIDAFDYIISSYPQSQLYPYARRMVINAREEQVKNTYPVDKLEIRKLIANYQKMLGELGINNKTLEALRSTAGLYAYNLDEKDSALAALSLAKDLGKADRNFADHCKLDEGDIYLLKNEPWESTLLYSQVEKSEKEELLGYEAKLKNAKLSYYKGDFKLAKSILDILKMATSREIANDAEQLSLIIQDNTGLDTLETAMREYAAIDLLLFQNKTDQAISELEQMLVKFKNHSLTDEILWLRANTYLKQGKIDAALADLQNIVTNYPMDILGDDAMFLEAKIIEEQKKDKTAAMDLYQKFLVAYPSSIYGAEARKRFRILRGDVLN